jgi:hypothetical protein
MHGPLTEDFRKPLEVEWDMLNLAMKSWKIVERKPWMDVLPSMSAPICKRCPDGMIRKLKARFGARGDKQFEGDDLFETPPVCNWQTVRIMLIFSLAYDFSALQ